MIKERIIEYNHEFENYDYFCPTCKNIVDARDNFCSICGQALTQANKEEHNRAYTEWFNKRYLNHGIGRG